MKRVVKTSNTSFSLILGIALALAATKALQTNAPAAAQPKRQAQIYKINTNAFYANLKGSKPPFDSETNWILLREYFKTEGVNLWPPSALFLNVRKNTLMVVTTPEIQSNIPPAVAKLNSRK